MILKCLICKKSFPPVTNQNCCSKKCKIIRKKQMHDSWVKNHQKEISIYNIKYNKSHRKEKTIWARKHYKKYRIERLNYEKNYYRNINRRLIKNLRTRLSLTIRNNQKYSSVLKLIDCSLEKLKQHLEKQFTSGMNWSNYGRGWNGKGMVEWHIDHIRPCASFDLSKPSEQYKCFHYTNLQPLWAKENMSKNDKFLGENNE